jgi:hypothetical protein
MSRATTRLLVIALAATACVAAMVALSVQVDTPSEEPAMLEQDSYDSYDVKPGRKQPEGGFAADRRYDPMARDGYTKRGSFFVERRVFHNVHDKFYLIATGTPGHRIRCTVRGYKLWRGKFHSVHFERTYTRKNAVMTDFLPALKEDEKDILTCNDLVTGERRYFTWTYTPEEKDPTDDAASEESESTFQTEFDEWLGKHNLTDFENGPLHETSGAMKDMDPPYPDGGYKSPGEKWLEDEGHPMVYYPKYASEDRDMYRPRQSDINDMDKHDLHRYMRDLRGDLVDTQYRLDNRRGQEDSNQRYNKALDIAHPATISDADEFQYGNDAKFRHGSKKGGWPSWWY